MVAKPKKAVKTAPKDKAVDIKDLLKAGVHFGHKSSHWNSKMQPYVHSLRGGVYIIDLAKTVDCLAEARQFTEGLVAGKKKLLFVGTKRHIRGVVETAAKNCSMPYVTQRWFGGILTNFSTISKRIEYFIDLEQKFKSGELAEVYSKREVNEFKEELAKLNESFGGIKEMSDLPGAIFVADTLTDSIAVKEANKLSIPVVGLVDTNTDPSQVDYPIPANDDAISSVEIISNFIADAVNSGKSLKMLPRKNPSTGKGKPQEQGQKKGAK